MSDKPKNSFLLYIDSLDVLDELTDEQAGQLFKSISAYHKGQEVEMTAIVRVAFSAFKSHFDRDLLKYNDICEKRRAAGAKGGNQKKANLANATKSKQSKANLADSDSDIDSDKTNRSNDFDRFWKIYPKKVKKKEVIKKWKARKLDRIVDVMIADVENRIKNDERWKQGFIPDPTTYINGDRWDDELTKTTAEKGEAVNWWDTADGIKQKGEEFGITESRFDSFPEFKNAVFQEAKNRQSRRMLGNVEKQQ